MNHFFLLLSYLNIYFIFLLVQLYFLTFYEDHWFVFVVDIKDRKFVFLDSFYSELHAYQQYVREKMVCFDSSALFFCFVLVINYLMIFLYFLIQILEFQFWWNRFVKTDTKFREYGVIYPSVPKQSLDNKYVYVLFSIFDSC